MNVCGAPASSERTERHCRNQRTHTNAAPSAQTTAATTAICESRSCGAPRLCGIDGMNNVVALSTSAASTGSGAGRDRPTESPSWCNSASGTRNFEGSR